jgi:para-aminobenzoate synthetase component I
MVTVEQAKGSLPSPAAVAARLRLAGVPGLVFLDSAGNTYHPTPLSIITADPAVTICGSLRNASDVVGLQRAIDGMRAAKPTTDLGLPMGGLFGTVDFDGSFCFGQYSKLLVFEHARKRWFDIGGFVHEHKDALNSTGKLPDPGQILEFVPLSDRSWYEAAVRQAQEYIAAGDIYQVNIAHAFESAWSPDADAFPLYQALRRHSPAPYSAFVALNGRQVLSASPESFLKISGNCIRTCPIKGTRPRFRDEERDEKSAYDLLTSPKEVAELIMITDLERNDLGQICDFGSVRVSELLKIERFEQVFHLVSTVNGQLRPDVDHVAALCACFPGGSITGAPKKRATEIIAELEQTPRGLYTGAIGYIGANGETQFNIAIRTVIAEGNRMRFHAGAGIVADSDPAFEYEETLHKAAGILQAAASMRPKVGADHCSS